MKTVKKSPDNMTFLEHLGDLRKRIFLAFISVIVAVIPCWFFAKDLFKILARPVTQFLPEGEKLVFTSLPGPFLLYMKTAFLAAVIFTSPFIFYQVWLFIAPGLYKKEKKYIFPFISFTTIFFLSGAAFAYFIVFPWACRFFLNLGSDFNPMITIDQYFSLALRMILGIALVFELPTIIFFLARMGIVTSKWMIKNFKYAVLAVYIIAAVITPTPDMINQSIVAVPMLILYAFSILIAFLVGKKKEKKNKKDDLAG
ncbi:MAG TPA: twin-arginine translocase subunit TatC [bacterium]|nr:twin-arginine translocase subunit TatC [bacterium]